MTATASNDWVSIYIKDDGTIITEDGKASDDRMTWREATKEEMEVFRSKDK